MHFLERKCLNLDLYLTEIYSSGPINIIAALVQKTVGAEQAISHYLNQSCLDHWLKYASLVHNELLNTCLSYIIIIVCVISYCRLYLSSHFWLQNIYSSLVVVQGIYDILGSYGAKSINVVDLLTWFTAKIACFPSRILGQGRMRYGPLKYHYWIFWSDYRTSILDDSSSCFWSTWLMS